MVRVPHAESAAPKESGTDNYILREAGYVVHNLNQGENAVRPPDAMWAAIHRYH